MERGVNTKKIYNSFTKKGIPDNFCDCLTGIKLNVINLRREAKKLPESVKVAKIQEITFAAHGILLECQELTNGPAKNVQDALLKVLEDLKGVYKPTQPHRKPSGVDGATSYFAM